MNAPIGLRHASAARESRDSPLRAAVIGAGLMGRWHAHYASKAGACITAIVDHNLAAAETLRARYSEARVFSDVASMLAAERPEVAHVCTPTETHVDIVTALLAQRVHVLVEKPLAQTPEETVHLMQQAEAAQVRLCPVFQFPFQQGFLRAQKLLGHMGTPLKIEVTICSRGAERLGTGGAARLLHEILPHPISLFCMLWQEPRIDLADWDASSSGMGELFAHGRVGPVAASVFLSAYARPPRCEARVLCTGGTLFLDFFHGYAAVERDRQGRAGKIMQPFLRSFSHSIAAMCMLMHRLRVWEPAYPGLPKLIAEFYASTELGNPPPISRTTITTVSAWCDHIERKLAPAASGDGRRVAAKLA